jgi:16S rRNA (guanine(966)-N(2))-methyltransferase RsmD
MANPRIISGTARGMRLRMVPGDMTRPITDRVKESLFNIIGPDIFGASFLDLFGGTGSVGIEALSRGAAFCRFIDINREALQTIRANLEYTRLHERAQVLQSDALQYLKRNPDRSFDYLYIAPPQYKGLWERVLIILDQNLNWLTADAWVIVQIDPLEEKPVELTGLVEFDRRKYGSTLLLFFELADD